MAAAPSCTWVDCPAGWGGGGVVLKVQTRRLGMDNNPLLVTSREPSLD